jgi:hypothetical protein
VTEGLLLTFPLRATDTDLPAQRLTYRLAIGPAGMVVTTNGVLSWTPTEAQGPSTNRVRVSVSDGVSGISQEFDVIVAERNQPPVWTDPGTRRVSEGLSMRFQLRATDADLPAQTLVFRLVGGPEGLVVSTNGVLSWSPTEAQGPSTNRVEVSVSDGVVSVSQEFRIVVLQPASVAVRLTLEPVAGGGFELRFTGASGARYVLQQAASPAGGWTPVPQVPNPLTGNGPGSVQSVSLPVGSSTNQAQFFRFVQP